MRVKQRTQTHLIGTGPVNFQGFMIYHWQQRVVLDFCCKKLVLRVARHLRLMVIHTKQHYSCAFQGHGTTYLRPNTHIHVKSFKNVYATLHGMKIYIYLLIFEGFKQQGRIQIFSPDKTIP